MWNKQAWDEQALVCTSLFNFLQDLQECGILATGTMEINNFIQ